jgi:hypothetical protein
MSGHRYLFWLLLAAATGDCQTTQGLIAGRVVDSSNARPVAGARVSFVSLATGAQGSVTTGTDGYYGIPLLPPGRYRLRITSGRYQPQEVYDLELPVAARLDISFRLRPLSEVWESGQYRSFFLPEREAVVTFFGPDVDPSRTGSFEPAKATRGGLEATISQVVDPGLVSKLPLAGRDVYTALVLQPGVAAGAAAARGLGLPVSGQRPTSSNFLLDGADNNNDLITGPLITVAPEAIQEYRISTNNFSTEYGGTGGVLANAVVRAGGNSWHGLTYFYLKNDALNGNDFQRNLAGLPRPPLHESQAGFQAGGPVLRDRLYTSTSFEYLRSRGYGDPLTIALPSTTFLASLASLDSLGFPGAAYATSLLRAHPFAPPQSQALTSLVSLAWPNFADRRLWMERVDYAFPGGEHRLMGRISQARLTRPDFLWSPYQGFDAPLVQNTYAVVAALTSALSPNMTNEARLSWTTDDLHWDRPHPEIPTLFSSSDQTVLPGSLAFYSYRNRSGAFELTDGVTWARGRHLIQFGGGARFRQLDGYLTAGRDGQYTFHDVDDFAAGRPYEFAAMLDRFTLPQFQLPKYDREYGFGQFSFYGQDTLRVRPRLTLNLGIRYESFGAPSNSGAVKDAVFVPGSGLTLSQRVAAGSLQAPANGSQAIYRADRRDLAGRFGASYDLTGKGQTILQGGYGIFYDRPFDNLWANVRLNGSTRETFDITADVTNYLAPYLPQLPTFSWQAINTGFPNVAWIDSSLRSAYVQSFFAGVRRQVAGNLLLELNGAGVLGRRLISTDILNREFADNPNIAEILYRANQGSSTYSAFMARAEYRLSAALIQAAYTWSHSIDNQSSPLAGDFLDLGFVGLTSSPASEPVAAFTEEQNGRGDRGSSDFDQRHNLVLASILELPSWHAPSPLIHMTNGWRFATLASFRAGFPLTVYSANQPAGTINRRADLVNPDPTKPATAAPGGQVLLHRESFAEPAGVNGNLGRNAIGGPGLFNIDLSLNRTFRLRWLGEGGRLHLRGDFYNFLNHANLGNPDPNLASPTFGVAKYGRRGQPTGFPGLLPLTETARQVQIMIRAEW